MIKRYEIHGGGHLQPSEDGRVVSYEDYAALEKERDRLLVLATKHCDTSHHDWDEILTIANDEG